MIQQTLNVMLLRDHQESLILTSTWAFEDWKGFMDAIHNELKLPIEITIDYNYKDPCRQKESTEEQIMCKDSSHTQLTTPNLDTLKASRLAYRMMG